MSKVTILILAAGSSSRMGKTKQLLPFKHTTILGWVIEQAQASKADEVICVLGARAEEIEHSIKNYRVMTTHNTNYKSGLSSSIVHGVKKISEKEAVLIMLADQPNVTTSYLNKLIAMSVKNPSTIIASEYDDSAGVPAVFPKKYYPKLLQLKGDRGAKAFLNQDDLKVEKIKTSDLVDVDTPEDYNRIIN